MAAEGALILLFLVAGGSLAVWFAMKLRRDRNETLHAAVAADLAPRGCKVLQVWRLPHPGPTPLRPTLRCIVDFTDQAAETWTVRCDVALGPEPLVCWLGEMPPAPSALPAKPVPT